MKEKALPLAIGLNILLPGLGYLYMGKWLVGIVACLLVLAMYFSVALNAIGMMWITMNIIMAIDMYILFNKRKGMVAKANTMQCPSCAESIQRAAKVCRFCHTEIHKP